MPKITNERRDNQEVARVRDDALKRVFSMPHKPHKPLGRKKPVKKRKKA